MRTRRGVSLPERRNGGPCSVVTHIDANGSPAAPTGHDRIAPDFLGYDFGYRLGCRTV